MQAKIFIGCVLLLSLTACGPVTAIVTEASPTMASVCSMTQPSSKTFEWGLSYVVTGSPDFVKEVNCVLNDDRSWIGIHPAKAGNPDFFIKEIDHTVVKGLCGTPYSTDVENAGVSCSSYHGKFSYINIDGSWTKSDLNWRILLINHEMGHELGYNHDYGAPCSVMHDAGCPVHPGAPWPPEKDRKVSDL